MKLNLSVLKIKNKLYNIFVPSEKRETKKVELDPEKQKEYGSLTSPFIPITKERLEELLKQYPQNEKPNIIESEGDIIFEDKDGNTETVRIPLLTIIPIPYIKKEDVDMDAYYKEYFKDVDTIKNLDDIKGVTVDVPPLNITPVPLIPKDALKNTDFI